MYSATGFGKKACISPPLDNPARIAVDDSWRKASGIR
jgi:hypothetical protein